jgi:hypothetical protein
LNACRERRKTARQDQLPTTVQTRLKGTEYWLHKSAAQQHNQSTVNVGREEAPRVLGTEPP